MSKGLPTRRKLTRCMLSEKEKVSARMSKRDPDGLVDRLDRRTYIPRAEQVDAQKHEAISLR